MKFVSVLESRQKEKFKWDLPTEDHCNRSVTTLFELQIMYIENSMHVTVLTATDLTVKTTMSKFSEQTN